MNALALVFLLCRCFHKYLLQAVKKVSTSVVDVEPHESSGAEEEDQESELAQRQLQAANMQADLITLYSECKKNGFVISAGSSIKVSNAVK